MKIIGLRIDRNWITQVLVSTLLGALIGFGFELWRGNHLAVFLCAVGGGVAAIARLRRQQKIKQRS